MTELEFAKKIDALGGDAYLVGGAVRDKFRGILPHDKDYCVTGVTEKDFSETFPQAAKFGKAFPVFSVVIDEKSCEVALARRERKISSGYRGFKIDSVPDVTIEEDLYRRDTTINAMALEILTGEITDPFGGRNDIAEKKIRAVSKHFTEDPVRALRAARQSAQFGFEITPDTLKKMKSCDRELSREPGERIFAELKSAMQTDKPSIFFRNLQRAEILQTTFPEIFNLIGKIQPPEFHPEGDAYEHSLQILDEVARINKNPIVRFAALVHDIGKGETPKEMLPHHYEHDRRGAEIFSRTVQRINLPKDWRKFTSFVIKEHMRAPRMTKPGKIVNFLLKLNKMQINLKDFCDIIRADNKGLPAYLEKSEYIIKELLKITGDSVPPEFTGENIGQKLLDERIKKFLELNIK